ncbi:MAG: hypothetical protein MR522_07980 [Trueperella sp.]|uniref:hypothetical protein n=1 Tax=Trueperella sp. TaxID=2699835 RepID=UPI0025E8A4C8|nr:hypothetical protein [Trueperella sp.]MCI7306181.1 hypothetical protein [Trueperella sp.]
MVSMVTLPVAGEIIVLPGEPKATQVFEWEDGERKGPLVDEKTGLPIWRIRSCRMEVSGMVLPDVTLNLVARAEPTYGSGLTDHLRLVNAEVTLRGQCSGGDRHFAQISATCRAELKTERAGS